MARGVWLVALALPLAYARPLSMRGGQEVAMVPKPVTQDPLLPPTREKAPLAHRAAPKGILGPVLALALYNLLFYIAKEASPRLLKAAAEEGGFDVMGARSLLRRLDLAMTVICLPAAGAAADAIGRRPAMALSFFGLGLGLVLQASARQRWSYAIAASVTGATKAMPALASLAVLQAAGLGAANTRQYSPPLPEQALLAAAALAILHALGSSIALAAVSPTLGLMEKLGGASLSTDVAGLRQIVLVLGGLSFAFMMFLSGTTVGAAGVPASAQGGGIRRYGERLKRVGVAVTALRPRDINPVSKALAPLKNIILGGGKDSPARAPIHVIPLLLLIMLNEATQTFLRYISAPPPELLWHLAGLIVPILFALGPWDLYLALQGCVIGHCSSIAILALMGSYSADAVMGAGGQIVHFFATAFGTGGSACMTVAALSQLRRNEGLSVKTKFGPGAALGTLAAFRILSAWGSEGLAVLWAQQRFWNARGSVVLAGILALLLTVWIRVRVYCEEVYLLSKTMR